MLAVSRVRGKQQVIKSKEGRERCPLGLTAEKDQILVRRSKQGRVRPSSFQDLGERDNQARGQAAEGRGVEMRKCLTAVQSLSRSTLHDPMDCSTPGFLVLHQLPELAQTHVHWVGDSIQPSHPLSPHLLLPPIFTNISVFSNELALCIRQPKYWRFSFSPSNGYSGLIFFRITGLISLQSKGLSRVFSSTTVQKHQFFGAQRASWSNSHIHT